MIADTYRAEMAALFPDAVYDLREFAALRKTSLSTLERAAARGVLVVHQDSPRGARYVTRAGILDYLCATKIRPDVGEEGGNGDG